MSCGQSKQPEEKIWIKKKGASLYSAQLGFLPVALPFSVSTRGIGTHLSPRLPDSERLSGFDEKSEGPSVPTLCYLSAFFFLWMYGIKDKTTLGRELCASGRVLTPSLKSVSPLERFRFSSALIGFSGIKKCIRWVFDSAVLPVSELQFSCFPLQQKKKEL